MLIDYGFLCLFILKVHDDKCPIFLFFSISTSGDALFN